MRSFHTNSGGGLASLAAREDPVPSLVLWRSDHHEKTC
jgi:hypothetical protein